MILVTRAIAGFADAQTELCRRCERTLRARIRVNLGTRWKQELEDDLAQQTWMALFSALPQFRGDCSLQRYASTIAFSVTLKALRRRHPDEPQAQLPDQDDPLLTIPSPWPSPEAQLASRDAAHRITTALKTRLAGQEWRAFDLVFLQGFTPETAAQTMGCTRNNVDQLVSRIRQEACGLQWTLDPAEPLEHSESQEARPPPRSGGS